MKSLNQEGGFGDESTVNDFSNLMANLLTGLKNDPDLLSEDPTKPKTAGDEKFDDKDLKNTFSKMMGDTNSTNFDDIAQKLLKEFMDKDILMEPLQEAEKNYVVFLKEKDSSLKENDKKNYVAQLNCIQELIIVLNQEPNNKDKMINLFEKMHDFGTPPEGILNPLNKIPGMPTGNPSFEGPEQEEIMGNFEKMMNQNPENCNIF